ncbi:M15 family metallopeptidase [Devosia sp. SL43]|uniref:M15 family metallopeptidase n=1 Tax=Devosia sp. SL43 TaxID=2806348 RepID=UPI001F2CB409|nr:M15 family metallopeptidase [Devosia sp. SL43]UJW87508.1 M15 family metallopeptidase [Devosia sp. SL43]
MRLAICPLALLLLAIPATADDAAKRAALVAGYPDLFVFDGNDVVFPDGTRIVWDDGKARGAEELIASPDVEDMFHYVYPLAAAGALTPDRDFDPGRIRNENFFKAIYGASAGAVDDHVVSVPWLGGSARVTTLLDIDQRLAAVAAGMTGELVDYGRNPGGGFNWRVIAGTSQLSVHSFGAAFDINVDFSDYWRWAGVDADPIPFKNRIPLAVVALFEAEGFIWGGRWYHYDTMHFEYRPELIAYAKAMAD